MITRLALLVSFCLGVLLGGAFWVSSEYLDGRWMRVATTIETTRGETVRCFTLSFDQAIHQPADLLCAYRLKDGGFNYRGFTLTEVRTITVEPEAAR